MWKKTRRILSMVLSIVMLLGIIPVQALAAATIDAGGMIAPQEVSDSTAETPPGSGLTAGPGTEPTPGPSAGPDAAPPAEKSPAEVTDPGTQPEEVEGKNPPPSRPSESRTKKKSRRN